MNRKFILDTSVILKYASYYKLYRLFNIVIKYRIIIFVNDNLVVEIEKNLPKIIKSPPVSYQKIMEEILLLTTYVKTTGLFDKCPDPKDNFLFDIAIQTGSEVIVSDEKKLLNFKESPVPVKSLAWFKVNFPIEL